jgi:hypothetical protein
MTCCPTFPPAAVIKILLFSLMMLFSFAMLFSLRVFSGALNGTSHGVTHQPAPRTDAARIGSA